MNLSAEQFKDSGPSPTPKDAFITVSHLSDSIGWNLKHGTSHLFSLIKSIQKSDIPAHQKETIVWHAQHTMKHTLEAGDDARRLNKHVAKHPAFRGAVQEIRHIDPTKYGPR